MKILITAFLVVPAAFCSRIHAQGLISPQNNLGAETRLYSEDGPLAGPNILGQFFIGLTEDTLEPFLDPRPHFEGKWRYGGVVYPGGSGRQTVYVQLVAWDSTLWGSDFGNIPLEQLGKTDVAPAVLGIPGVDPFLPTTSFSQPAIVPIPEPSTWAVGFVGLGMFLITQRSRIWKC